MTEFWKRAMLCTLLGVVFVTLLFVQGSAWAAGTLSGGEKPKALTSPGSMVTPPVESPKVKPCAQNQIGCANVCIDPNTDSKNCGACGKVCPGNQVCNKGGCGCEPKYTLCGNSCTNLAADSKNCGSCGFSCSAHYGTVSRCQAASCKKTNDDTKTGN